MESVGEKDSRQIHPIANQNWNQVIPRITGIYQSGSENGSIVLDIFI